MSDIDNKNTPPLGDLSVSTQIQQADNYQNSSAIAELQKTPINRLVGFLGRMLKFALRAVATLAIALVAFIGAGLVWITYNPLDASKYQANISAALDGALPTHLRSQIDAPIISFGRAGIIFQTSQLQLVNQDTGEVVLLAKDSELNVQVLPLLQRRLKFSSLSVGRVDAKGELLSLSANNQASNFDLVPGVIDKNVSLLENAAMLLDERMDSFGAKRIAIADLHLDDFQLGRDIEISSDEVSGVRLIARFFFGKKDGQSIAYDVDGNFKPNEADPSLRDIELALLVPSFDLFASAIRDVNDGASDDSSEDSSESATSLSQSGDILFDGNGEVLLQHSFDPNRPDQDIKNGAGSFVTLTLKTENSSLKLGDDDPRLVSASDFRLNLYRDNDRITLEPSRIIIGDLRSEILGAVQLTSLSKDAAQAGRPVFEIISNESSVLVPSALDPKDKKLVPFGGRIQGNFSIEDRLVEIASIEAVTRSGKFLGAGSVKFVAPSPSIVLSGAYERLDFEDLLAIWPIFLAADAREWLQENVVSATFTDGKLDAAIPAGIVGRMRFGARMQQEHLSVTSDFSHAHIKGIQKIPDLRSASGQMSQIGQSTNVAISSGRIDKDKIAKVDITNSSIKIEDVGVRPLLLGAKVSFLGEAGSLANLANSEPINAFSNIDILAPDDFSGASKANVKAQIQIEKGQLSLLPDWQVEVSSDKLQISKPISGRSVKDADIVANINAQRIQIDGRAKIDGLSADINIEQALASGVQSSRSLSMSLDAAARKSLGLDLGGIVTGTIDVELNENTEGSYSVKADLTKSKIVVPGTGWTKGSGIAGKASFKLKVDGNTQRVTNLKLSGGGLRAVGSLIASNGTLSSLKLSQFGLNKGDKASLSVERSKGEYVISLSGQQFDVRPFVSQFLARDSISKSKKTSTKIKILGKLDLARGFNDERLNNITFGARGSSSSVDWAVFDGFSQSGAATKLSIQPNAGSGDQLSLSSSDVGSFLRFTDVYSRVRGGSADIELVRASDASAYVGALRARKMSIVNEPRLSRLVNSRAGGERSLNESLKGKIQTEVFEFDELVAEVALTPNDLSLNRGVIRGPVVGSTFSGLVFDGQGNMQLKGVFIPAYGVNQLISSLPIIGQIFGNAQSGGFLGISWSLRGETKSPRLDVNPISLFTPGVFREIFNQGN